MKFLIKLSIIIFVFTGYYLCSYDNYFSEFLYKVAFCIENTKEYIHTIVLQNKNINNSSIKTPTSELMNEYFITIFNENSITDKTKKFFEYSNFSILNIVDNPPEDFKNQFNFSERKNFLAIKNENSVYDTSHLKTLNENLYRFFNYDNFSIAYLKPKLQNNKDLLNLYKYIKILENNFYIPIVFIDKSHLNENLLKSISYKKSLFIVIDDEFSLSHSKNIPILHLGSKNNLNLFFEINLFIANSIPQKIRFKIFPLDENKNPPSKESFQEILNDFTSNYKFNFNENTDYIYFDYTLNNSV